MEQQMEKSPRVARPDSTAAGIDIRAGYEPGLIGRIAELHGRYYAGVWKSGAPFEILMSRDICEFMEGYDAEKDLVLAAYDGEEVVGSISMIGRIPSPDGVQLRFFIVDPRYHGRGVGKRLLSAALDWCRARACRHIFLWTVDQLPESRRLYERAGFQVVERHRDDRYTVERENLKMRLTLSGE